MSNLRNTVLKSMVLGATKNELANDMPGGLLQIHTVSSGLEKADTLNKRLKLQAQSVVRVVAGQKHS